MLSNKDKDLFRKYADTGTFLDKDNNEKPSQLTFDLFKAYSYTQYAEYGASDIITHQGSVSNKIFKQMRRGNIDTKGLDLHGKTTQESCHSMAEFIHQNQHKKFLRIIHGKGLSSPNQKSLLKTQAVSFLKQHPQVLAFCSCTPQEGGTGALYIYLKHV
jgi:DNA-nicking Smr family endonuclease